MNIKLPQRYTILKILLLSIPVVCYYDRRAALLTLAGLFVVLLLFKAVKSSGEGGKNYSFCFLPVGEKEAQEMLYLVTAFFVIVKFFEQNIAVFSISIVLVYKFVSAIFKLFARVKIRGTTLESTAAGTIAVYFAGYYLCGLLGLDNNVAVSSAVAVPFIELIVSWPDKNFSLPFLLAVTAQFVKNSF